MRSAARFALAAVRQPRRAWLLARVAALTIAVPLLYLLPLPTVRALLSRRKVRACHDADRAARIIAAVDTVQRLGRPVRRSCLTRATTLYWFLRGAGLDVQLCFGSGFQGGSFEAHCWLERDAALYLEPAATSARFTAHFRVPAAPRPFPAASRAVRA